MALTSTDVLAHIRHRLASTTPAASAGPRRTAGGRMPPRHAIEAWCDARGIDRSRWYLIGRSIADRRRERDA